MCALVCVCWEKSKGREMKHRTYGYCVVALFGVFVACAVGQEFIKSPKVKKVYVSCQQYLELEGELTLSTNSFFGLCSDVLQIAFLVQECSLNTINTHVDGEKECFLQQADKVERTAKYSKLMKIKQEFDRSIDELTAMIQRLRALIADFNGHKGEKIQSE